MKPRTLLAVHRWLALVVAPFLLLQAATGAALLWRDEIEALIEAPRATAPVGDAQAEAPLSALAQAARSASPGWRLARINFPATDDGTVFAQLDRPGGAVRHVRLDPGNAVVLSSGSLWHYPLEAALQLHYRLAGGAWGMTVVCLLGASLALIALTGLWHWWPGRRRIAQALRIPARTPDRLKLRMWHRTVGAVLAGALLVIAVTGSLTVYPDIAFAPAAAAPPPLPPADPARTDAALAAATARYPDAQVRDVRFRPDGTLTVNFRAPRGGFYAIDTVVVDTASAEVAKVTPYEANTAWYMITLPIHTGTIADRIGAGWLARLLLVAAAAGLLFLSISGPLAWWRARRHGKAKAKAVR